LITIDAVGCQKLREELNSVLEKYGIDSGLRFTLGTMKYDSISKRVLMKLEAISKQGGLCLEEKDAQLMIEHYCLNTKAIDRETNEEYTIVGYRRRRPRYPWLVESQGRRYKITQARAEQLFGKKK
jgi:hypothetical protein